MRTEEEIENEDRTLEKMENFKRMWDKHISKYVYDPDVCLMVASFLRDREHEAERAAR